MRCVPPKTFRLGGRDVTLIYIFVCSSLNFLFYFPFILFVFILNCTLHTGFHRFQPPTPDIICCLSNINMCSLFSLSLSLSMTPSACMHFFKAYF